MLQSQTAYKGKMGQVGKRHATGYCLEYILPSKHPHYLLLTVMEILHAHQGGIYSPALTALIYIY